MFSCFYLLFQFTYVGEVDLPKFEYGDYQVCLRRICDGEIAGCNQMVCRCWPGPRHALRYIDPVDPPRSLLIQVAEMLSLDAYCYAALSNEEIETAIEHRLDIQYLVLCVHRPSWMNLPQYVGALSLNQEEDLSALQKHKLPREDLRVQTQLPQKVCDIKTIADDRGLEVIRIE